MPPYSMDFRQRVVALHDEGMPTSEIAEMMRCRPACVRRLMQRRRELGTIAPTQPQHPDQRLYDDHDEAKTRRLIQQRPDAAAAAVLAGPESDRAGHLEDQDGPAEAGVPHGGWLPTVLPGLLYCAGRKSVFSLRGWGGGR